MKNTIKQLALLFGLLLLIQFVSAEEKTPFKRRFSLKLSAGFMSAGSMGDVNNALESFNNNEVFDSLRKANSDRIKGQIEPLNNRAFDWEAELRFDLTPRIGFGVAVAAPFHAHNESTLTYIKLDDDNRITLTWFYRPEVKVFFPVKLSAYYSFSFIRRLNISIGAGVGIYPLKIAQIIRLDSIYQEGEYQDTWDLETKWNFALGYHGTAILKYFLGDRLAVVAEFQMRHIRKSDLAGNEKGPDPWGGHYDVNGTLYYSSTRDPTAGASYAKLRIFEDPVPDDSSLADLRKAVLDLSGFSLRIGLKMELF